eukprot:IDg1062t1
MIRTPRHQKAPQVRNLPANLRLKDPLPMNPTADLGEHQEEAHQTEKTKKKELRNLMGEIRRNTAFFNFHIPIKFDGEHPIEILRFLRKFVDTCKRLEISEMEAFVMIPFFLSDGALRQFESARRSGGTALFGLNDWPSTVNWLLR